MMTIIFSSFCATFAPAACGGVITVFLLFMRYRILRCESSGAYIPSIPSLQSILLLLLCFSKPEATFFQVPVLNTSGVSYMWSQFHTHHTICLRGR